jgi:hypothetical protein
VTGVQTCALPIYADKVGELDSVISSYFAKRFSGDIKQVDVQLSYKTTVTYTRHQLLSHLGLKSDKPVVIIFPHAFSDFPHICKGPYADYFEWFKSTIEIASLNPNINWLVKPHPTSGVFNETGIVDSLIHDAENIFRVPDDFNTASVVECADLLVTCRGTIAVEFGCFGIPTLTVGDSPYNGYGIDFNARTKLQYVDFLSNPDRFIGRLDDISIENAKYIFYYLFIKNSVRADYVMNGLLGTHISLVDQINNIIMLRDTIDERDLELQIKGKGLLE